MLGDTRFEEPHQCCWSQWKPSVFTTAARQGCEKTCLHKTAEWLDGENRVLVLTDTAAVLLTLSPSFNPRCLSCLICCIAFITIIQKHM